MVRQVDYMESTGARVVLNLAGADNMKHVEPGDFVIHLRSFQGGLERSALEGKVSLAYTVLQPRAGVHGPYFGYLLKSDRYVQGLRVTVNQLRDGQSIRYQDFAKMPLPLPPLAEQVAIADLLDRETTKIDTLIDKQRALISIVAERSDSLIDRLVWPFVEEAGLPGGWELVSLTRTVSSIVDYRGATPEKLDKGVQLITARNIKKGFIDYESSQEYVEESEYSTVMRRGLPAVGDLLMTMEAPLGNFALVDRERVALAQRVIKMRPGDSVLPEYLLYAVLAPRFQAQLASLATGSTALGLKARKLHLLRVPVPPLSEQRRIVKAADRERAAMSEMLAKGERLISLAQERRSALITAAVTGQLGVATGKVA